MNSCLEALQQMPAARTARTGRCSTSCFFDHSGHTIILF